MTDLPTPRGRLTPNRPLSELTWLRVGGPADWLFQPADAADLAEKRQLLRIVCLNWTLDGVSLRGEWRRPFDVLAGEPLVVDGGGGGI